LRAALSAKRIPATGNFICRRRCRTVRQKFVFRAGRKGLIAGDAINARSSAAASVVLADIP